MLQTALELAAMSGAAFRGIASGAASGARTIASGATEGGAAGATGAAIEALSLIPGPAGKVAGAFKQVWDAGERLVSVQLQNAQTLRGFNAGIQGAFVQLEMARFQNKQAMAAATSDSAKALVKSQQDRERATLPSEIGIEDFKNEVAAAWNETAGELTSFFGEITGFAARGKALMKKHATDLTPGQQALQGVKQIARGDVRRARPIQLPPTDRN